MLILFGLASLNVCYFSLRYLFPVFCVSNCTVFHLSFQLYICCQVLCRNISYFSWNFLEECLNSWCMMWSLYDLFKCTLIFFFYRVVLVIFVFTPMSWWACSSLSRIPYFILNFNKFLSRIKTSAVTCLRQVLLLHSWLPVFFFLPSFSPTAFHLLTPVFHGKGFMGRVYLALQGDYFLSPVSLLCRKQCRS